MSYLYRQRLIYQAQSEMDSSAADSRVGTLVYSLNGLLITCVFLLIGSLGFNLNQQVVGTLLPKQLDDLGASNVIIALLITALPSCITMVCNPIFSTWSDRTRTGLGRRRPFLLFSAPLIAVCMVVIGWTPVWSRELMALSWFQHSWFPLLFLGIASVCYNILFMFPMAILWYLFPDVVPAKYLTRYMAAFNIVAQGSGVLFGSWLIGFADGSIGWLYTGAALFFMVSMSLLVWGVREGDYPPVENRRMTKTPWGAIRLYLLECYSIPFYYCFFLAMALSDVSQICGWMFNLLYAQKKLGISLEDYGSIMSYSAMIGLVCCVPFAWLSDRLHPMRFFIISLLVITSANAVGFFYVDDERSFLVISIVLAVVYAMQTVCTIPVFVAILPAANYGQFSSANALFRSIFFALGGLGGGMLFDYVGDYQYIYAWDFCFTFAAFGCFLLLYRNWKRRGGPGHYQAPVYQWKHASTDVPPTA